MLELVSSAVSSASLAEKLNHFFTCFETKSPVSPYCRQNPSTARPSQYRHRSVDYLEGSELLESC